MRRLAAFLAMLSLLTPALRGQDQEKPQTPKAAPQKPAEAPTGWATSKEIREWKAHQIFSIDVSPDEKLIVTASEDLKAKIWNTMTGETSTDLTGHEDWVRCARFSPDGSHVLTGGEDQKIILFATTGGKQVQSVSTDGGVLNLEFSPDGKTLAVATKNKVVQIFSYPDLKLVQELKGHTDWVWSIAYSPDGKWLASASEDDSIRLWNVENGTEILALTKNHDKNVNSVYSVAFHPENRHILLTGHLDNSLDVWDLTHAGETKKNDEGEEIPQWKEKPVQTLDQFEDSVRAISFSSDGKYFATGSSDNMLRIWAWKGIEEAPELIKTHEAGKGMLWSVDFAPSNSFVATGGEGQHVRLFK